MAIDFSKVYDESEQPEPKRKRGKKSKSKARRERDEDDFDDDSDERPARGRGRGKGRGRDRDDDDSDERPARGRGRGKGRGRDRDDDDDSDERPARGRGRRGRGRGRDRDDDSDERPARGRGRGKGRGRDRDDDDSDERPARGRGRSKGRGRDRDDDSDERPARGRGRGRGRKRDDDDYSDERPARGRGRGRDRDRDDEDDYSDERPARKRSRRSRRKDGAATRAAKESARLAAAKNKTVVDDGKIGGEFRELGLCPPLLQAITDMEWEAPSPIQERVIPFVLEGRDVVGQARTGTGKTGAFAVPVIDKYHDRPERDGQGRLPISVILSPTRELALQIYRQLLQLGAYTSLRCVAVYGGAPMEPQLRALRAGADIVVGTPGRVMDHIRRGTLRLDDVTSFILDEADRMFDLGFRDDIYWVSSRLPEERQTLLLSATMPDEILQLSKEVTNNPELIYTNQGNDEEATVDTIEQFYVSVDPQRKMGLLEHLVGIEDPEKGIVFTRTKRGADRVAERLRKKGYDAGEIHSDLKQKQRERVLERFREGNLQLMIATDVAARGLDINGVTHVFNFDVPQAAEDYVHRVGRTARMGRTGRAITFLTRSDGNFLSEIEKKINKMVENYPVEGYRVKANEEEKARSAERENRGRPAGEHPFAKSLSPALRSILAKSTARKGPGGRGGGRGGGGGRKGGRGGGRGRR